MNLFHCDQCHQILYFENTKCLSCGSELGFLPDLSDISSIQQMDKTSWKAMTPKAEGRSYKKCKNYKDEDVCNWMVPAESSKQFCIACDLNVAIPNLEKKENKFYWYRLEVAKRRLIFGLMKLNLPIISRELDPEQGLGFQFLEDEKINFKETKKIMTGHANGLITINLAEADDAARVKMRVKMKESYRTILGHFRHEIGHYYWTRLIENTQYHEEFRALFGDERQDYTKSLKSYYDQGAPSDWQNHFVSAYGSSHPWEDWAETWAHYLHIVATLETAQTWGMSLKPRTVENEGVEQQTQQSFYLDNEWLTFDAMYENWTWMICAINSMNRSMGQRDFYPFVLSKKAIEKLRFVDRVIKSGTSST